MTDYNNGEWHGWNGGKCPLHPKTKVEFIWLDTENNIKMPKREITTANNIVWDVEQVPVVAFRVVEEYKEPREWWAVQTNNEVYVGMWIKKDIAEKIAKQYPNYKVIHVREVI